MRAVPQPVRPQSSSSHHVAPDFTALASLEPGFCVTAYFVFFENGVRRWVHAQDIALRYHREDIPVVCGAPATSLRRQAREWTVALDVINQDIFSISTAPRSESVAPSQMPPNWLDMICP